MHIIINAIGSSGDINPFILIATRLKNLGHRVDFVASPYFADRVQRQGLNLVPIGTLADYAEALQNPDVWKLEKAFPLVWQLVMKAARTSYDLILDRLSNENTLLVGSSLAVGARLVQEKRGLPMATVHLSPSLMLSSYATPQSATNPLPDWTPRFLKSAWISAFTALVLDPACMPSLNALRRELQLPPVSRVVNSWLHSPDLVLCAFPDWFASVQPDWPPNSFNCNFLLYRSEFDLALPAELENFLAAGEPPLVFTAGTAMAFARPFLQAGVMSALKTGKRAVLVCDFADQVPLQLPDNVLHVRYANFEALFKRAALVAHHGGIGTSAMALSCACPQLIAPFAHDQHDNAARLQKLGVAKMIERRDDMNEWCRSINALLRPEIKENCGTVKNKLARQRTGEDEIVDLIMDKFANHHTGLTS